MHTSSVFPLMCEGRLQGVCSNGAEVSIRLPDGSRSFGSRQAWGNCSPWPWSTSPPPNSSLRPCYKRQCKRCTQLAHFFVITFLSGILVFNIFICAIKDILLLACLFVMFVTRPHATWQYIWHFQYFFFTYTVYRLHKSGVSEWYISVMKYVVFLYLYLFWLRAKSHVNILNWYMVVSTYQQLNITVSSGLILY